MNKTIQGVLTAIVTPFAPTGEVGTQRLRKQVQRQIAYDNGVFCNGTNGEFFVLDMAEKLLITETCVDEVAGKVPIVAHIGEISTATTLGPSSGCWARPLPHWASTPSRLSRLISCRSSRTN